MIVVVDLGSQTTHLIARRVRELGVYSEIVSHRTKAKDLKKMKDLEGIILSGGPAYISQDASLTIDKKIFELGIPVLGICYGMQLMGYLLGGKVKKGKAKEYGGIKASLKPGILFKRVTGKQQVWMSHGDQVVKLPKDFKNAGSSRYTKHLAMVNEEKNCYGIMFHPEVVHTTNGMKVLRNFVLNICRAKKNPGISLNG